MEPLFVILSLIFTAAISHLAFIREKKQKNTKFLSY